MNKLKTLVAAMLLTTASAASAVGVYEYDNFTTSLNGEVGLMSSYEYNGISLSDQPTIFAKLDLLGIDGSLKGWYIGGKAIGTNTVSSGVELNYYVGWKTLPVTGWKGDIGVVGKNFTRLNWDDLPVSYKTNTDYGLVYGKLGYVWDNDYQPGIGFGVSYSNDYYNAFGDTMFYTVEGGMEFPTRWNPVELYARWNYTDSQDNSSDFTLRDYSDYKVGIRTDIGKMDTNLSVTWIDSKEDFVSTPFFGVDSGDNATVNLTVSYHF